MADGQADLVSIITPSLNRGSRIVSCMNSVCSQTYTNIEHIIVDGGSSDNTLDILRKYESKYRMRWVSEPDAGMYAAINKGLGMTSGAFIAYLNTDDLYFPYTVEIAVRHLRQPACKIVFGDMVLVREDSSRTDLTLSFYPPFHHDYYSRVAAIGQPTVFMRREVFESVGYFDESYDLIADCDYWLRAASAGFTPMKIAEILAVQIDHPDTLRETRKDSLRAEFERLAHRHGRRFSKGWERSLLRASGKMYSRLSVIRFLLSLVSRTDPRWGAFRGFAGLRGIRPNLGQWLGFLLIPKRLWRPARIQLFDPLALLEALAHERLP